MAEIDREPGVTLHCDVDDYLWPWDDATPVVMLHGLVRNADIWRRWIPLVAAKHRVYRPELRGCGRSSVPPPEYELDTAVLLEDLRAVLDRLGVGRAHFVGESSGGLFAMLFAARYPDRMASLVQCYVPSRTPESIRASYSLGED